MLKRIEDLIEKYENRKVELKIKADNCKGSDDINVQALRHSLIVQMKLIDEFVEDLEN